MEEFRAPLPRACPDRIHAEEGSDGKDAMQAAEEQPTSRASVVAASVAAMQAAAHATPAQKERLMDEAAAKAR